MVKRQWYYRCTRAPLFTTQLRESKSVIRSHPAENVCTVVILIREVLPSNHGEKWSTPSLPLPHQPLPPKIPPPVPPLSPSRLLQHSRPPPPHPALNQDATPFSPSSTPGRFVGYELPDWLAFTHSFSEGRSRALGRFSSISPSSSFVDVVRNKVKALMETADQSSTVDHIKGKDPMEPNDKSVEKDHTPASQVASSRRHPSHPARQPLPALRDFYWP
jgi:hypothetical protein